LTKKRVRQLPDSIITKINEIISVTSFFLFEQN